MLKNLILGAKAVLSAGTAVIGKVRLVTATGDEITNDVADAIQALVLGWDGSAGQKIGTELFGLSQGDGTDYALSVNAIAMGNERRPFVQDADNADGIAVEASAHMLNTIARLRGFNGTSWDRLRSYGTGILKVGRAEVGLLNSGVLATDTAIKASAGKVYWLTVSDTAALAIELNDSANDGGTDKWAIDLPAAGYGHFIFDPPLEMATGIWLDVSTATCKVTVGYI